MNKKELIAAIADQTEISKAKVSEVLDAAFNTIQKTLVEKSEVRVAGFGTFATLDREAATGRDPRTGEDVDIPSHTVVRFKASKDLKEALGGGLPRRGLLRHVKEP